MQIPNEIIVALIGLAGSAIGSIVGIVVSGKVTQYRLEQLEKKVDKHNNLIERTFHLEEREALLEERLRAVNDRLDVLEEGQP